MKQATTLSENAEIEFLMKVLRTSFGDKSKSVKTDVLLAHLNSFGTHRFGPQSLRRYIGHIRNNDMMAPGFIVSSVQLGYWFTTESDEMNSYLQQQLDRMGTQFANVEPLHRRLKVKSSSNTQQMAIFV